MDAADAIEQPLTRPNRLYEGIRLLGQRHEEEVAQSMVVDRTEPMRERARERRVRILRQGGQALADVPRRDHVLALPQQAGGAAVIGHRDDRVDARAEEPQRADELGLPRPAPDGNRFDYSIHGPSSWYSPWRGRGGRC